MVTCIYSLDPVPSFPSERYEMRAEPESMSSSLVAQEKDNKNGHISTFIFRRNLVTD